MIKSISRSVRAFTLIELLAVIAIISLLMGILIPSVNLARNQAKKIKTAAQISAMVKACEAFSSDVGRYPKSGGKDPFTSRSGEPGSGDDLSGAQWLALQLVGADLLGYVKPVRSNDTNGDGIIDGADWRAWYDLAVADRYPRLGPYIEPDGQILQTPEDYETSHAIGGTAPDELKIGSDDLPDSVPFFVDAFGYPIIYYRANPSAKAPVTTGNGTGVDRGVYTQSDNAQFTGSEQDGPTSPAQDGYDFAGTGKPHLMKKLGYAASGNPDRIIPETFVSAIYNRSVFETTRRNNDTGRIWPYNAKSFLIISPGKDGLFGTGDDIQNFDTAK